MESVAPASSEPLEDASVVTIAFGAWKRGISS